MTSRPMTAIRSVVSLTFAVSAALLVAPASAHQPTSLQLTSPGRGYHRLFAVDALSHDNAWAVGFHGQQPQATTRHWNGTMWEPVHNPPTPDSLLLDVHAVEPDDVWAVGQNGGGSLAEHWDGARWGRSLLPQAGAQDLLFSVSGEATDDVWAVGEAYGQTSLITVTEHWDGTSWSIIPSPNRGDASSLRAVAAVTPTNVWAVGRSYEAGVPHSLIEHWDGARWTIVPSPGRAVTLHDVAAVSASDAWAVGEKGTGDAPYGTFIIHWNGDRWKRVPSPDGRGLASALSSVSASSPDDVWAVGASGKLIFSPLHTLIEHWNGNRWAVIPSPSPGKGENTLSGVSAVDSSDAWAVGDYANGFRRLKSTHLYLHWNGARWRQKCPATPC